MRSKKMEKIEWPSKIDKIVSGSIQVIFYRSSIAYYILLSSHRSISEKVWYSIPEMSNTLLPSFNRLYCFSKNRLLYSFQNIYFLLISLVSPTISLYEIDMMKPVLTKVSSFISVSMFSIVSNSLIGSESRAKIMPFVPMVTYKTASWNSNSCVVECLDLIVVI